MLVMDNASYHTVQLNKKPVMYSLTSDILKWLHENCHVYFDPKMTKAELMLLVKEIQIDKSLGAIFILSLHYPLTVYNFEQ